MTEIQRNSFSRILAAAILEALPGAEIAQAGLAYHGYFCEFICFSPLSSELLIHLGERIRQIIREKREVRVLEMVPFSASELLKKEGQKKRAVQVLEQEGLVRIVRIGSFVDWCEQELFSHTGQAGVFRLLEIMKVGKGRFRVFGITAFSKKELKQEASKWFSFPEKDHDRAGSKQCLWETIEGHRIWLAEGLALRERWISFWKEKFRPFAQEIEGGQEIFERLASRIPSSMEVCRVIEEPEGSVEDRGLLNQPSPLVLQINHFADPASSCISFLQTIDKSLTILGFTYRLRYSGRKRKDCLIQRALSQLGWKADEARGDADQKLEFLVEDALQCGWPAVEICERRGIKLLSASVWIERNLALLLERDGGNLSSVVGV